MKMNYKKPSICLVRPEIPQNTGNIGRLAAATNTHLFLVGPLGFSLEDRYLRRAGLDYWPYLDWSYHETFVSVLGSFGQPPKIALLSTKATSPYTNISPDTDLIVFGRETGGLSTELREGYSEALFRIPMSNSNVRSLNLANSVSIVLYHQLSQIGF